MNKLEFTTLEDVLAAGLALKRAHKTAITRVHKMDSDFVCHTRVGTVKGKAGDYLAVCITGEVYPIKNTTFHAAYQYASAIDERQRLTEVGSAADARNGATVVGARGFESRLSQSVTHHSDEVCGLEALRNLIAHHMVADAEMGVPLNMLVESLLLSAQERWPNIGQNTQGKVPQTNPFRNQPDEHDNTQVDKVPFEKVLIGVGPRFAWFRAAYHESSDTLFILERDDSLLHEENEEHE